MGTFAITADERPGCRCERAGGGEREVQEVADRVESIQAACADGLLMDRDAIGGPSPRRLSLGPSRRWAHLIESTPRNQSWIEVINNSIRNTPIHLLECGLISHYIHAMFSNISVSAAAGS